MAYWKDYLQEAKKNGTRDRVCLEWQMLQTVQDETSPLKDGILELRTKHKEVLKLVSKEKAYALGLIAELKEQQKKTAKLTAISLTASVVGILSILLHVLLILR